eukprot:4678935-Pyramimonas_sp.AAC.1
MGSAFASGEFSELDATVELHVENCLDVPLALQRNQESRSCVPTAERGPLWLRPGEGGLMGDPSA